MKRGSAHHHIESVRKRKMQQIARDQADARAKLRCQVVARRLQHVLGKIDARDAPARQCFEQIGGKPSGSAARIEHHFIAAQLQSRQNFLAPTDLRPREAVIDRGIPLCETSIVA